MFRVLKFAPAVHGPRAAPGPGPARRLLLAALLRVAELAANLAVRLESADAHPDVGAARRFGRAGALGVRLVEAAVSLAVAAYFVAGLVGVLAA